MKNNVTSINKKKEDEILKTITEIGAEFDDIVKKHLINGVNIKLIAGILVQRLGRMTKVMKTQGIDLQPFLMRVYEKTKG